MANGRGWGQDATLTPGWARVGQAALNAAAAPETWVPAAGALAFQIGDADRNMEKWAANTTPLYGSQRNAGHVSNRLRDAAGAIWVVSALATPSGDTFADWTIAKTEGFGVQTGAGILMRGSVGLLKDSTDRTRPNGYDKGSFPSAHAANAAFFSTLASRNLETLQWSVTATTAAQVGLGTLTAATAWARVEANQHFPSDVLGGIALGHFLGAFFTDAFLGLDNPGHVVLLLELSREGTVALIRFNY